jgi:hypothetical protein
MENQRKAVFLGKNFNGLYRQEQEYLRNLVRSLFQLQNSGITPAVNAERTIDETAAGAPAVKAERNGEKS